MSRDENSLDIFEATMAQVFIVKTITCFKVKKVNFYRLSRNNNSWKLLQYICFYDKKLYFFLNNALLYRWTYYRKKKSNIAIIFDKCY